MDSSTLKKAEFHDVRRILADYAATSLGKAMALNIGPSRNPEVIRHWLEQTTQMVAAIRDVGLPPFGGVTDISEALKRAHPGAGATGEDYAAIASTLEGAANVRAYLAGLGEQLEALHELAGGIGAFDGEIKAIRSIVAPDGTILDIASERLTELRRRIEELAQHIHDVIYGYLHKPEIARLLQNVTVTLHGDRYVLPVRSTNRGRLPGVVHRASNTGATVFVEPNESVELNNRLADLREDERREVRRLLNQLAIRISGRSEEIAATLHALAGADLLSAKAQYAYQNDMTCPEVHERGDLLLSQARHPLLLDQQFQQEKLGVDSEHRYPVVPINLRLGSDFDLLVITGSNTGGKTVALKTLALLVLMAQSGMHIPVQRGAKMPVFRDVFIDVGDEQSLQQSLSTFGAHIKRIRYILRKADSTSLVLLDELGAGTDPDEGGAIGQAVLDELRRIGCLGMVTTHLSVLKAYAYNHERVDNASVEFDTATLSPTYHLQIGMPGESHAITVARRLGMPRRVMNDAKRHHQAQGRQFRKAIQATNIVRESAEKARGEAHEAQLAAENQQEAYQAKLADLHRLQEEFETWLANLSELKAGDEVFVPSLGKSGKLVRLELHKQVAVVEAGSIQAEVPLRELMPDLGQVEIREKIASLRKQILDEARQTESARAEVRHMREELQRSLQMQRRRAQQFDAWLTAISRLKVGSEVPIARKPGKGKVVKVNLAGLRATILTDAGEIELSLQDLFPQTGPFVRRPARPKRPGKESKAKGPPPDRPIQRRSPESHAAKKNRNAVLATQPGQQVFVVPFNKRATLIRINEEKDQAVVQSGIFEMEIPISDLEPVRKYP